MVDNVTSVFQVQVFCHFKLGIWDFIAPRRSKGWTTARDTSLNGGTVRSSVCAMTVMDQNPKSQALGPI